MSKFGGGVLTTILITAVVVTIGVVSFTTGQASRSCAPPVAPRQCEVVGDEVHCVAPVEVLIGVGE